MKKLNFGCGDDIRNGWVNVDLSKKKGIDKSFDFDKFPYPFKKDSFDYIFADSVIEHLQDLRKVFRELWRISKKNTIIEIIVPYYNHVCAFNEPDHEHFFNERTFYNLIGETNNMDNEGRGLKGKFKIIEQKLKPGKFWKWLPSKIRVALGHYISNLTIRIDIKIKVIK
jgi:predicted SAM-dependent methyltransferase